MTTVAYRLIGGPEHSFKIDTSDRAEILASVCVMCSARADEVEIIRTEMAA